MPVPKPQSWFYYCPIHGQHISFYSLKTLQYLAKKYGLQVASNGRSIHLLTEKRISSFVLKNLIRLARNGLHWVVDKTILKGKPMHWIKKDNVFIQENVEKL